MNDWQWGQTDVMFCILNHLYLWRTRCNP